MPGRTPTPVAAALLCVAVTSGCTPLTAAGPRVELADSAAAVAYTHTREQPFHRQAPHAGATAQWRPGSQPVARLRDVDTRPALSPGDRLRISVHDGEEFSGLYEIDMDGSLNLPLLGPLQAAGVAASVLEQRLAEALIAADYFRPEQLSLSVAVQQWAPALVTVSGAVFAPGQVAVNARQPEERAQKSHQLSGDYAPERLLQAALRAAGGLRPDADPANVLIMRGANALRADLSGLFSGGPVDSVALAAGDTVIVPSTGRFDAALVRPTAATAPGVRVYLSNLTVPATGNAQSAIGQHASSLPYGSRLLTALLSANCVGGTGTTNAGRYAVLVSRDARDDTPMVIERSIDDLLRAPARDDLNPLLMPDDGVACFDSGVTNLRDIARTIGELILPFSLL